MGIKITFFSQMFESFILPQCNELPYIANVPNRTASFKTSKCTSKDKASGHRLFYEEFSSTVLVLDYQKLTT